jgi:hypothetical protein
MAKPAALPPKKKAKHMATIHPNLDELKKTAGNHLGTS